MVFIRKLYYRYLLQQTILRRPCYTQESTYAVWSKRVYALDKNVQKLNFPQMQCIQLCGLNANDNCN